MLALEQAVKGFFFILAQRGSETLYVHFALGVVLNCDVSAGLFVGRSLAEHVEHEFIVYFGERDLNSNLIVETAADLAKNFVDGARNDTSVLEVRRRPEHRKGFSSASLSIAHDGPVVAVDERADDIISAIIKNVVLGGVVQNLVEFEFPGLSCVVDHALARVFGHAYSHSLNEKELVGEVRDLPSCPGRRRCFWLRSRASDEFL